MRFTKHGFGFSTGKEIYANGKIIGISPTLDLSEGYDGGVANLNREERLELAEYMINLWREFKHESDKMETEIIKCYCCEKATEHEIKNHSKICLECEWVDYD